MDNKTVEMTMLFDFFGELLTEKQREYFDLYYHEDLSLSEIAENYGITRQGVYDIITRAGAALRAAEEKTHVVARFTRMQRDIAKAEELVSQIEGAPDLSSARALAAQLGDVLENLKG